MESVEESKTNVPVTIFSSLAVLLASVAISGSASAEWPLPISGLIVPLFMLYIPWIGIPVFAVLFLFLWLWWFRPLISKNSILKKSSLYILVALFIVSIIWYYISWEVANTYRRPSHAIGSASINIALMFAMLITGISAIRKESQTLSIVVRAVAIVWVVTYGFAYFGELP